MNNGIWKILSNMTFGKHAAVLPPPSYMGKYPFVKSDVPKDAPTAGKVG